MKILRGTVAAAILILFTFISVKSQVYTMGYIVKSSGDTLKGLVAPGGEDHLLYKRDIKAGRVFVKKKEMIAFSMDDKIYSWHKVQVMKGHFPEEEETFLEVVVNGAVSLMEYQGEDIYGNPYTNMFVFGDGDPHPIRVPEKEKTFKKQMSSYFGGNESLSGKISGGEMGIADIKAIVGEYNEFLKSQGNSSL